jgi:uncharacterized membrane protein
MATTAHEPHAPDAQRRLQEAKRPINAVAGPYGHPFHPILVTLPIGAWIASVVFDVASKIDESAPALVEGAYWLIGLGVVGAVVAAVFGLLDLFAIPSGTRARRLGLIHLALNVVTLGMFVGGFLWRSDSYDSARETSAAQLALSLGALALLAVSGWIGGMLAYRFGVRVADERTQAEGYA